MRLIRSKAARSNSFEAIQNILASLLLHGLVFAIIALAFHRILILPHKSQPLAVELIETETKKATAFSTPRQSKLPIVRFSQPKLHNSAMGLLYVPKWVGTFNQRGTSEGEDSRGGDRFARDLLETESKVWEAFDVLAGRINRHLDYPKMLAENGVQGSATLDLLFDSNGDIDESRSKTFGDNRLVRGMLVRAGRKGLVEWISNDRKRLQKEQLRNQRFRAEFILAYSQADAAVLTKIMPGSYGFLRRHFSNVACIGESNGAPALNIACVAVAASGAIQRSLSDKYKGQITALKDRLEQYDEMNLSGINAAATDAT